MIKDRYIVLPEKELSPLALGLYESRILTDSQHWRADDFRPCDICFTCGHSRSSHLDQPHRKGEPPQSDRGWCTRPEGSCIFNPCSCLEFIEATEDQIEQARKEIE